MPETLGDPLDRPLDDADRRALLGLQLLAVFSTVGPDGSVHSVPIHLCSSTTSSDSSQRTGR